MKLSTLAALAALACVPAATAQADPEAPSSQPPAAANPMDGSPQAGNLGVQSPVEAPKASSNAEVEHPQLPGPPDFPENNELPDHGGPDLPPRPAPPAAAQQQEPAAQPQLAQPVEQQQPAQSPSDRSAPQPQSAPQPPAQQPAPNLLPAHLPGVSDLGALVGQVLGALPAGR